MDRAAGEAHGAALRVAFDPRLKLEFHGSKVTSDAGLLAFRDLDGALGLTELAGEVLADTRTGQNSRHTLIGSAAPVRVRATGRIRVRDRGVDPGGKPVRAHRLIRLLDRPGPCAPPR